MTHKRTAKQSIRVIGGHVVRFAPIGPQVVRLELSRPAGLLFKT